LGTHSIISLNVLTHPPQLCSSVFFIIKISFSGQDDQKEKKAKREMHALHRKIQKTYIYTSHKTLLAKEEKNMKKIYAALLSLISIAFASVSVVRPAQASISSTPTWVKPAWRSVSDSVLGYVDVGYVTGTNWTLNVNVHNDAWNGSQYLDAKVNRIAVWFDWDKFYNTTFDVTIPKLGDRLLTVIGVTESTSIASNLFTHSYKIYVEYEMTYSDGSGTVTKKNTWGPSSGSAFAVLSQDQYDSQIASSNYYSFYYSIYSYVDDYAASFGLLLQASKEQNLGSLYYSQGEFATALTHYNAGLDKLNQSLTVYMDKKTKNEDATLDKSLAENEAIRANATATTTLAQATASAAMNNSYGYMLFGLGFIIFGIAAIIYAMKRPKAPS
jgi:hypothetical protein